MANTKVFLDTDVIISWLSKEVDPKTKFDLWKAPYGILKKIESGELTGLATIINLMEIIFVLRRKKKWGEEKICNAIGRFQDMNNLTISVPGESDIISAYNLQNVFSLDPFNSIYFAIFRKTADYLVSRDKLFIDLVNKAEGKPVAFTPESFPEK
jgi:predicted nucleic acid-binding protein